MATVDPVKNFAIVTVSTGYDAAATSIALTTGHGASLPAPASEGAFNLVWWNYTDYKNPSDDPNVEIVRCTARSTDTLTVTRAQESTSASTKNTSAKTYKMALTPTAKTITDLRDAVQKGSLVYAADAGANDSYAITLDPAPAAYTTGMVVVFKANTANTGAATLNVNSLGAKTIKKLNDQDLATGDIEASQFVVVVYDGTNFQMVSQVAAAPATGAVTLVETKTPSSGTSATFSGLTGDSNTIYKLIVSVKLGTTSGGLKLTVNGDTGAVYNYQYTTSASTTVSGARTSSATNVILQTGVDGDNGSYHFYEIVIQPLSGYQRPIIANGGYEDSANNWIQFNTVAAYSTTSGEITSITIGINNGATFAAGSVLALYKFATA